MGVESQAGKAMGLAGVRVGDRRGLESQPGGADSSGPHWSWGRGGEGRGGMYQRGQSHGSPLLPPERGRVRAGADLRTQLYKYVH